MNENFDPSGVAVKNGEFFGIPSSSQSEIVVLPIPWDVTTSYRAGTVRGPEAILESSYQVDLFSPFAESAWKIPLSTDWSLIEFATLNTEMRKKSEAILEVLSAGTEKLPANLENSLKEINSACRQMTEQAYLKAKNYLKDGKRVVTLGGDHSVPLGSIKAYSEKYPGLSILHFDAHADLRVAYEGFEQSHASIMYNVLQETKVAKIVQVGIRDVAKAEIDLIDSSHRMVTFFNWDLQQSKYQGVHWKNQCDEIIAELGPTVYVSFDIDGMDPVLCPNTGTPVPGGLSFDEASYLIRQVVASGKKIVGADLVEVSPGEGDFTLPEHQWDGNVGARMLFLLCCMIWKSKN